MEYGWLIYALLSAAFAALVAIFGKIGLEKVDTTLATAIRGVIMAAFLVAIIILTRKFAGVSSIASKAWLFIVLSGIAGALSWLCYFVALKAGKASQVAPIDRLSVVFVIIFAVIFLGEKLSLKMAIGVALMAIGSILLVL